LLAELRDPAFCFLLVVGVYGGSQIVTKLGDCLIGLAGPEVNYGENQAGIDKYIFTLAKHFHGFGSDAGLANQGAAQHILRAHGLRIDIQGLARFGFRFLISIQQQKREGKILVRLGAAWIEREGGFVFD
jgi:hypothetical protein